MALRAVAFDVDGTLYPNGSMYLRSLGLALANVRLLKALERVRRDLREAPEPTQDFHRAQARLLAVELGITPERAHALVEARVYTRWYRIFARLRLYPGLKDAMAAFRARGLKLGILSDFPIRHRLEALGLEGPWDCAFSSEETGYLKPRPEAFLALAERLGLPPAEVLYVGNSYSYDIEGADAAGMPAAHLTRSPHAGSRAVLSFQRYAQLKDFVFRTLDDPGYHDLTGRVPV